MPTVSHLLRASVALAVSLVTAAQAAPISFSDLLARPRPSPTKIVHYGSDAQQYAELWSPDGKGPHRVVVMIHGGCWLASLPGTELMAYISEDLRRRGLAVWSIEYRRVGGTGGGYPGTFEDVGHAIDDLRAVSKSEKLDLDHVVAVGPLRGADTWRSGRPRGGRLPTGDRLFAADPLAIKGVVSLAGIPDLAAYRANGPSACGGPDTIDQLVNATGRTGQNPYADTSPAAMLPLGVPQTIVSGTLDPIVPMRFGDAYAAKAKAAGDQVQALDIPGAGHFELIDPTSDAWRRIEPQIEAMLK